MLTAKYLVAHSAYTGSSDADGYPTGDAYGTAVQRPAFGWQPLSSQLNSTGDYDRRVITSKVLLVPDASPYAPRDKVVLPDANGVLAGTEDEVAKRTYWVSQDVRNDNTGPFPYRPGGEIILEVVTG
jgi:hypothetical protein